MPIEIHFNEIIQAPRALVWDVITRTADYPQWNPFVVACQSSFAAGAPIVMRVKLLPGMVLRQKETVRVVTPPQFLEYGIRLPFGLLESARQHILAESDDGATHYQSRFVLRGWLSPLVSVLLGDRLRAGFAAMTQAIVQQSHRRMAARS